MSGGRRVVVDSDCGIDDALALLYLGARPDTQIVAVASSFGNCAESDAVRNIGHVLRLLDLKVPVARGATGPLHGDARRRGETRRSAHGRDGLGDLGFDRPMPLVADVTAPDLLVELARERPGHLDLLVLGPLTNCARALRAEPALFTKYRSVTVMGGCGPYAPAPGLPPDTNTAADPAAARAVAAAPRHNLTMVGLNVTATVTAGEEDLAPLRAARTPAARFAATILTSYLGFYERERGVRAVPLHDPLAAAVLADPGLETARIDGPVNVLGDGPDARAWLMRTPGGDPPPVPYDPVPGASVVVRADAPVFVRSLVGLLCGA
ncbi:nucleoside hydrolase [Sphaerisporangium sp. B11E5]|uniref:nucleoside hydrolase n=1 Tax=Sphaerisporangium sp. B11E5 TaxID=3153563 RepID=UPI00325E9CE4